LCKIFSLSFRPSIPGHFSPMLPRLFTLPLLMLLALSACSSPTPPAHTEHTTLAAITISDAWIRQPPPGAAVAGAYLRLRNSGTQAERLLNIETGAAERVEIHEMQMVSGMMQMREITGGLPLPAGETTALTPGGLHLMLIAPKQELTAGKEVEMVLSFEHAPEQTVVFQVRSLMDAETTHGHHGH